MLVVVHMGLAEEKFLVCMDDLEEEMADEERKAAALDSAGPSATPGEPIVVSGSDKFFVPLRLACESKLPRVMEVALACIRKRRSFLTRGSE